MALELNFADRNRFLGTITTLDEASEEKNMHEVAAEGEGSGQQMRQR